MTFSASLISLLIGLTVVSHTVVILKTNLHTERVGIFGGWGGGGVKFSVDEQTPLALLMCKCPVDDFTVYF